MILMTAIYIIISVVLVGLVLLQQGKGAGMGILGGSSDTLLGSSAGNVLTRATSTFAVLFIVGALVLSILSSGSRAKIDKEVPQQQTEQTTEETPVQEEELKLELDAEGDASSEGISTEGLEVDLNSATSN